MTILITFLVGLLAGGYGGYRWGASVERRAQSISSQLAKKV
jgi:hypothetical protein